jgi:hypothetical protein
MKKIKPSAGNKTFCMAPWTHTYLSPQTERRMCCASRESAQSFRQYIDRSGDLKEYNPETLEQHWNNDHMKSVRKKMLAGEILSECEVCDNKLLNTDVYRDYFNNLFQHKIEEAFEKTDATGVTTMSPISFDYRFNNLCNFKCRQCGDMLSSSWEAEQRNNGMWSAEQHPWMASPLREKIKEFQDTQIVKEFMSAIENKSIEEIYWVGGEPLMWDIHWDSMSRIIELGFQDRVYARYNTNLSRITFKGKDLFKDLLNKFKDWQVCASIDGTGETGEYIRTGLKYNEWLKNFKTGLSYVKNARQMQLDFTITMPGLLELKNMFDLSRGLNAKLLTKVTFAFDSRQLMSPMCLPRELLHTIIDENLAYIKPRAGVLQKSLVDVLENMKTRPTFEEEYRDAEQIKQGKKRIERIDAIRNTDIKKILQQDERLLAWWKNI